MLRTLRYIANGVIDLLSPRLCPICHARVDDKDVICSDCLRALPRTEQLEQRDNITQELFREQRSFERAAAFVFFDQHSQIRPLVHLFKYAATPALAYQLAHEAALDMMQSDFLEGIDVIIPIPLHRRRLRSRGYNQSEYIARALHDVSGIPMDTTHLIRHRHTPQQALLSKNKRRDNVRDAFTMLHPEDLFHKHILLVDDVITTGSTVIAAIEAIEAPTRARHLRNGCRISVFAIGKAR